MSGKLLAVSSVQWPIAARLAGAFADCGWEADALVPPRHLIGSSRHAGRVFRFRPFRALAALRFAIETSGADLVIPCDDRALRLLLSLVTADAETQAVLSRSLGEMRSYPILLSRSQSMEAARALGIAVPASFSAPNPQVLEMALIETGFPVMMKLDGTWGGDGVALVHNLEEALAAFGTLSKSASRYWALLRAAKRRDPKILWDILYPRPSGISVQKYVTGTPTTCSFACWKGEVLAAISAEIVAARENNGPASVIKLSDAPEMVRAAVELAGKFGLSGLHGLDFIRDDNGVFHLIEVNPRATQTAHLALGPHRDLVAALIRASNGEACPDRPAVTPKDLIALFPQEWLRDAASPYLRQGYHDAPWEDSAVLDAAIAQAQNASPFPHDTAPVLTLEDE